MVDFPFTVFTVEMSVVSDSDSSNSLKITWFIGDVRPSGSMIMDETMNKFKLPKCWVDVVFYEDA